MTDINSTQAIILAVLHEKNASGAYIEAQARKLDGHWTVTRSQIYRELPKLADTGLISRIDPNEEWQGSEPYTLTVAGRLAYRDWYDNKVIPHTTRDPWILRQRLGAYTGITADDVQLLNVDATEWAQMALQREYTKESPDPLLVARYLKAIEWFSGSLA